MVMNKTVLSEKIENLFLCILTLFFIRQFLNTTMFTISYPWYFDKAFRTIVFLVVLLKLGWSDAYQKQKWLLCVLTGSTFVFSWIATGYEFLFDISLCIFGSMNVDSKKILKSYIWCGSIILIMAMLGAFTGAITDLLYQKSERYRHSFGIVYTTDFATHIVYLFLAAMVFYKKIPKSVFILIALGLSGFIYQTAYAKCSTLVLFLAAIGIFLLWLIEKLENRFSFLFCLKCLLRKYGFLMFPCCIVLMCGLMVLYNPEQPVFLWLNTTLSNRLALSHSAFLQYGIRAFGTPFPLIGNGANTVSQGTYNFVDTSYCLILLRYGFFVLLAACIYGMRVTYGAGKIKNDRLLLAIVLVAIHSMIEHHLLEPEYNVFLLLSFADLKPLSEKEAEEQPAENRIRIKNRKQQWIFAAGIFLGIVSFPYMISYGRTIVSVLKLYENWRHKYFLVAAAVVLIFFYVLFQLAWKTLRWRQNGIRLSKKCRLVWCAELLFGLLFLAGGEAVLSKGEQRYTSVIETEQGIMDVLSTDPLFDGKMYADTFPSIYRRAGIKLSRNIFSGESLCSESGVVLFTRKDSELRRLSEHNFYFGEFSDQSCVYTNHPRAIELLEQQGIAMTNYYHVKKQADLPYLAGLNGLPLSEQGGLIVNGSANSLIYGPYLVLYRGKFAVQYTLQLLEAPENAETVATVRVAGNSGQIIYKEETVDRSMFDENGTCVYTVETNIGNVDGVEFLLFAKDGVSMEIKGIEYGKIGR